MKRRTKHHRQVARLFKEQNGRCCWCNNKMIPTGGKHIKDPPDNLCTLEHLDDKWSSMRGKWPQGTIRRAVACRKCNQARSNTRQAEQPIELLRALSKRHERISTESLR